MSEKVLKKARKIHETYDVIDLHCDTIKYITSGKRGLMEDNEGAVIDFPKMNAAGMTCQVFAAWGIGVPERIWKKTNNTFKKFREIINEIEEITIVESYSGICRCRKKGLIGILLAVENGELIDTDIDRLYKLYEMGVRLLTLTWNGGNAIADGVGVDGVKRGLTPFGLDVVKTMDELGMIVDVSHLGEPGFWDCIKYVEGEIVASHSNCYTICPHKRNLKDEQIKAIAQKDGIIGINYYPEFTGKPANISKVCDHIEYISQLVGVEHVALGSDYDGTDTLAEGLENASKIPYITAELILRGYSETDISKILGGNAIRIFKRIFTH